MRKLVVFIAFIVVLISCWFLLRSLFGGVVENVVVYDPPSAISSFCKDNPSFSEIDRSDPQEVLFSKTKVEDVRQLEKIYTASVNKSKTMEQIRGDEATPDFKEKISQKKLLLSFYYYGDYGPPHWFCLLESTGGRFRPVIFLEDENGEWRQGVNVAKYPVLVAFFDLGKKHDIFNAKKPLTKKSIDDFIRDCRRIDEIITDGMVDDPEHYGSVQALQ